MDMRYAQLEKQLDIAKATIEARKGRLAQIASGSDHFAGRNHQSDHAQ